MQKVAMNVLSSRNQNILIAFLFLIFMGFVIYFGQICSLNPVKAFSFPYFCCLLLICFMKPLLGLLFFIPSLILVPPWYNISNFGFNLPQLDIPKVFLCFFLLSLSFRIATKTYKLPALHAPDILYLIFVIMLIVSWIPNASQESFRFVFKILISPFLIYMIVRIIPLKRQNFDLIDRSIFYSGLIYSAVILYEYFILKSQWIFSPNQDRETYVWSETNTNIFRPGGLSGAAPVAAILLALVFFFGLNVTRKSNGLSKILHFSGLAGIFFCLVLTFTRAVWFGFFSGFLMLLYFTGYKRYLVVFLLVFIIGCCFFFTMDLMQYDIMNRGVARTDTFFSRVDVWNEGLKVFQTDIKSVLIGYGYLNSRNLEAVGNEFIAYIGSHCYYLNILIEQGICGLFIYLIWNALIIKTALNTTQKIKKISKQEQLSYFIRFTPIPVMLASKIFGDYGKDYQTSILFPIILAIVMNPYYMKLNSKMDIQADIE